MIKNNYYISSFSFGFFTKIVDSVVKFISIPLLLKYLGIENYGILTLAIATNAYMALLDLGIRTGNIKFFSQWIGNGRKDLVDSIARTSITFYGAIGLFNAFVLIVIAIWGKDLFQLTPEQFLIFRECLFILAVFSIINWATSVFSQVMIAAELMVFVQKIELIKTGFYLIILYATIYLELSLQQYFTLQLLISALVFLPFYLKAKKIELITTLLPATDWHNFKTVLKYSIAIFSMGIFQMAASQARPLVLGIMSDVGVTVLAEYKIIQVFPAFIISISGMLMSILLPKTVRLVQENNRIAINNFAEKGTLLVSILVSMLCFPLMLCSKEILELYVGIEFTHLWVWLSLWLFNVLVAMHNTPIASMVLATGKTRVLVISSFISFLVSVLVNIFLVNVFQVGSAVIGYFSYLVVQLSFYYFYFNKKVLGLNSFKVFSSFIIPAAIGLTLSLLIFLANFNFQSIIFQAGVKSVIWLVLFLILLHIFKVFDFRKLLLSLSSKNNKLF